MGTERFRVVPPSGPEWTLQLSAFSDAGGPTANLSSFKPEKTSRLSVNRRIVERRLGFRPEVHLVVEVATLADEGPLAAVVSACLNQDTKVYLTLLDWGGEREVDLDSDYARAALGGKAAAGLFVELAFHAADLVPSIPAPLTEEEIMPTEAFPIGSIYFSVSLSTAGAVASALGYGTWSLWAAGRVPICVDTGDSDFNTVEKTGGAKTVAAAGTNTGCAVTAHPAHTHTYSGVPTHAHSLDAATPRSSASGTSASAINAIPDASATLDHTLYTSDYSDGASCTTDNPSAALTHAVTQPTFGGTPTSVVQPYITCYMWKRAA